MWILIYAYLDLLFAYAHLTLNDISHTWTNYLLYLAYLVEFKLHPASWDPPSRPLLIEQLISSSPYNDVQKETCFIHMDLLVEATQEIQQKSVLLQ